MRARLISCLCLTALFLPMSGCPGGATFVLGIWLIHTEGSSSYAGLEFLANGTTNDFAAGPLPFGAGSHFIGDLTWEQRGNTVTITQELGGGMIYTFDGTLQNATYMTGTRSYSGDPNFSQTFIATKAPSENLQP